MRVLRVIGFLVIGYVFLGVCYNCIAKATPHSIYFNGQGNDRISVFVAESAVMEYVKHTLETPDTVKTSNWFGAGVNTELGLEIEKFIQVSLNHTLFNTQNINNAAENMRGFRLAPEFKAIFSSLAFNLEFGAGISVSKFDYQDCSKITSVQGYGTFFSTGISYYFARHIAAVLSVAKVTERFDKINGDTEINKINTNGFGANLGIRIGL
jgi:hypothetical protein